MPDFTALGDHRSRLLAGLAAALEQHALSELHTGVIAREAGVSKRTFYEHFANKEECFLALYRGNSARILQALSDAVTPPGLTLLERIDRGTQAYLSAMQNQAPLMKRLYVDILGLGAEGMQAKREVVQQFADLLLALYEEERAAMPGLPAMKPELLLGVIAGLNELILFRIEDGAVEHLLELAETTRLLILGSMQATLMSASSS